MRAVVVAQPGAENPLLTVDVPDPGRPGPGQVRVRIQASTVNHHDGSVILGSATPVGHVPLADAAGTVEAVGEGVTHLAAGDLAFSRFFPTWQDGPPPVDHFQTTPGIGLPGYAQDVVVVPAAQFARAPRGWTAEAPATLTVAGLTAWRALVVESQIKAGDVVAVLGTGGVSIFALQIALAAGAVVVVTSSSDDKLERAQGLGADHLINYRRHPDWGQQIQDLVGGADTVVEVGGPGTLPQSVRAVRNGGLIALIGVLTGFAGEVPTGELNMKQARIAGLLVGNHRHQRDMVTALETQTIRPVIDRSFSLEQLAEAVHHTRSGSHFGKVTITF